jgi:hypothetical protein
MVDLISRAALIERNSMAKIADSGIRICEWERVRDYADGANRIPARRASLRRFLIDNKSSNKTTYQAPRKYTFTYTEKVALNCLLWSHPKSSSRVYILYANGTC